MTDPSIRHAIENSAQGVQSGADMIDRAVLDARRLGTPSSLVNKMKRASEQIRRSLEELRLLTLD